MGATSENITGSKTRIIIYKHYLKRCSTSSPQRIIGGNSPGILRLFIEYKEIGF
jgi:hypothetical protein